MTNSFRHITVLLDEAVEALAVRADGCYLDGTFGRGGHSRLILEQLGADGQLLGFDKDPLAIATGQALAAEDGRFVIVQRSFAELGDELQVRGLAGKVSGVLDSWNTEKVQFVEILEAAQMLQQAEQNLAEQEVKLKKQEEKVSKFKREDAGLRFTITCLVAFAVFQAGLLIWIATHR